MSAPRRSYLRMKDTKPDIVTTGIIGAFMIGGAICFPFFIAARLAHEAIVVVGVTASRGNFIHEIFFAAYAPFTQADITGLTILGFLYALGPIPLRLLPDPLGKWAFRIAIAYAWIGVGVLLLLGAVTAWLS